MATTRHAPDPLHVRETLCGHKLFRFGQNRHELASIGDGISCPDCRVVINMATKCVAPMRYTLVRAP